MDSGFRGVGTTRVQPEPRHIVPDPSLYYYSTTAKGKRLRSEVKIKVKDLIDEVM